ncbi:TIGR03757 family integrating conjugative element protein [Xenorhabdus innexi]|uniref:Integrating conjugative element protein n=1 Tax=Xenorhabdus innexi TaxID=290109 RepID=A0A1N6MWY2_9GAMM|nr:TIGR03757 family integrating conjugative element protein [Xenorhabdus innexi]PHM28135.1 integrating conjugative element protein [Xenorhabdus innexi]SIP73385.1 putative exported protein [Xenorhabdus innexi]
MKKQGLALLLGWSMAGGVGADTVVYTDRQHPPLNLTPDSRVVWLDGAEQQQQTRFADLSPDPQLAAMQAQAILQSPRWHQQVQQLMTAWRDVVGAWQLGVRQYPAVVFDDRAVVYGTADVARAMALREQNRP